MKEGGWMKEEGRMKEGWMKYKRMMDEERRLAFNN